MLSDYVQDFSHHVLQQEAVSNCSCDMHPKVNVLLGFLPVCNLPLVPSWMLAVVIGVVGGTSLYRLGPSVTGSLSYAITFFLYATMITSGLFVHCLFLVECGAAPPSQAYTDVALVDGSLTSSIAVSFLFNGLVDLRVVQERSLCTLAIMAFSYILVFFIYFGGLIPSFIFYKLSVLVGCSLYLLSQLLLLCKGTCHPLPYLLAAGVAGGGSFLLVFQYSCWLCTKMGAWSVEGVWYYGSDIAMFFILLYTLHSRQPPGYHSSKRSSPGSSHFVKEPKPRQHHHPLPQ